MVERLAEQREEELVSRQVGRHPVHVDVHWRDGGVLGDVVDVLGFRVVRVRLVIDVGEGKQGGWLVEFVARFVHVVVDGGLGVSDQETGGVVDVRLGGQLPHHVDRELDFGVLGIRTHDEQEAQRGQRVPSPQVLGIAVGLLEAIPEVLRVAGQHRLGGDHHLQAGAPRRHDHVGLFRVCAAHDIGVCRQGLAGTR